MNIGSLPRRHGRRRAQHPAFVTDAVRWTFGEFDRRTARLAAAFQRRGVARGDRIATLLPNGAAIYETYWAAARIGAATVPLSTLLRDDARATLLADAAPALVVADADQVEEWIQAEHPDATPIEPTIGEDDLFNIMYSSGTTGTPKGIALTYGIRARYCTLFAAVWRMTPESVVLHAGSLVFNGAFVTMLPAMFLGATFVLLRQFDPEALMRTIEQERVTHIMMVPSQIVALLNAPTFDPRRLASLQMLGSVGAPLHREHRDRLIEALPGRGYELYGLTEGFITILDRDDFERKRDAVGVPLVFSQMRIVTDSGAEAAPGQVGEIVGTSPLLTPGYYRRPDLTAKAIVDGWLFTGDLGFVDDDGFLHLVDRQKDMIISGAVNVYPRDIEEVIVAHPAVKEAAVFGIPHDRWGEVPMAAVIVRDASAVTCEELTGWINERVGAKYQRVAGVTIVDDFPRSTAGKTLKRVLRAPYWSDRSNRI
jgi:acyl-CoA synthetase (AMP-forming)/AMP-acid ligase II